MPLYTNIGGKLVEIKSLNTTNNGILKPIYGTPKDNLTLHWGGFTGESAIHQNDFLIGEFNIDSPTYVSHNVIPTDNLNNLYTSVPSDFATQLGISTDKLEKATIFRFEVCQYVNYKTTKTVNENTFLRTYLRKFSRRFTKNSNGNWEKTEDTFNNYNSTVSTRPVSFDENIYYVYVNNYARIFATDSGGYSVGNEKFLDFSQMSMDVKFTFQTLNNG